jgi:hypothetical protein
MAFVRRVLPVLICAAYLPAVALPCPAPGLDRAHPTGDSVRRIEADAHGHDHHGHHQHAHLQQAAPAAEARVHVPCPCGCGERATSAAGGGRLGPVLIASSPPNAGLSAAAKTAAETLPPYPEPLQILDPIPI